MFCSESARCFDFLERTSLFVVTEMGGTEPGALSLRVARYLRLSDPYQWIKVHSLTVWGTVCVGFGGYFNWYQYRRMQRLYPDYDKVRETSGAQYADTKVQELADVRGYNVEVEKMRRDLAERG